MIRILFALLFSLPFLLYAQVDKSALFVGNSYTSSNNLPNMISNIANSKGDTFTYETIAPGGFLWGDHKYSEATMSIIDSAQYDYLILQEQSLKMAQNANGFAKYRHSSFNYAHILDHQSKIFDSCRKTMLYLTWGRENGNGVYEPGGDFGLNFQDMQDYLTENFLQLADLIDAEISPVGEAWRKVILNHPTIDLFAADGSHPSPAGTYLAACVFYNAIFHKNAALGWHPAGMSNVIVQQLQTIADEVVAESYSNWNIDVENSTCTPRGLKTNVDEWSSTYLNNYYLSEICFTDNKHGFVKGTGPKVWQTLDAGESWSPLVLPAESSMDPRSETSFDLTYLNRDTVWYVINADDVDSSTVVLEPFEGSTGEYMSYLKLFYSTDGGISWVERSPIRSDYEILGAGYLDSRPRFWNFSLKFDKDGLNGTLFSSYLYSNAQSVVYSFSTNDGGLTWEAHQDALEGGFTGDIWSTETFEAYVSGYKYVNHSSTDPQKIFRTTDRGETWQAIAALPNNYSSNIYQYISGFRKINEDTLIAINNLSSPTFYQSSDNGDSWDSITTIRTIGKSNDLLQPVNGVYYLLINNTSVNRILASYDYGRTWEIEAYFDSPLLHATATDDFVYVVGFKGGIHRKPISLVNKVDPIYLPQEEIIVFPNPSKGLVNIINIPIDSEIMLYSITGAMVATYSSDPNGYVQFQAQNFSDGIYLIHITNSKGSITKKLIIEN